MTTKSPQPLFTRWFDLLAKHRMGGALLPICGISIGNTLVGLGALWPDEFTWYVRFFGVFLIGGSVVLFLIFASFYTWKSIRQDFQGIEDAD